jgi:hypothetical protein
MAAQWRALAWKKPNNVGEDLGKTSYLFFFSPLAKEIPAKNSETKFGQFLANFRQI